MSVETVAAPRTAARAGGRAPGLVLGAAALATGLLAGFFYAYSVSVMPGLANADDRTLVDGMQQINEAVENPVFFMSFLGAPVLTLAAAFLARGERAVARWTLAALLLCGVALLVTAAVSVPLNDDLAQAGDPGRIADLAAVREDYEDPWVVWNAVRTVASTAALGCLVYALVLHGRVDAQRVSSPGSSA
jgi:uncharacterized membrane protein